MRNCLLVLAAVLALNAGSLYADSIIKLNSPNGILLTMNVTAGYGIDDGSGFYGPLTLSNNDADIKVVDPTGFLVVDGVSSSASYTPPVGDAKDEASITGHTTFEFGLPFPGAALGSDSLNFNFSGFASAFTAQNPPDNLFASVNASAQAFFYLDPGFGGTIPDAFVGVMTISGLPTAAPGEFASLVLMQDSTPLAFMMSGDGPATFRFLSGHQYSFMVRYNLLVPNGDDPAFHYNINVQMSNAVPEPPSIFLVSGGVIVIFLFGHRRIRISFNSSST